MAESHDDWRRRCGGMARRRAPRALPWQTTGFRDDFSNGLGSSGITPPELRSSLLDLCFEMCRVGRRARSARLNAGLDSVTAWRVTMLRYVKALALLVFFVAVPAAAYAQASIVGTVRDPSAAVLPGVTVEASSPALIEKTRSVVTSGTGQYAIEDLRPGTYTLTFTLNGFATLKREGIELTGIVHRDGERGHESRRRGRDDHGHRRSADHRRDEHAQPAGCQRPDHHRDSLVPTVFRLHAAHSGDQRAVQ